MITTDSIIMFAGGRSPLFQHVFQEAISNKSPATQRFLRLGIARPNVETWAEDQGVFVGAGWQAELSRLFSIEDLFSVLEAAAEARKKSLRVRLFSFLDLPLRWIVGYICDIDLASLAPAEEREAASALLLAGLFFSYCDGEVYAQQ